MGAPTICMLSCLHGLYDDRIYWKEALSLKKHGYNVVHIGIGEEDKDYITEHGIRLISVKYAVTAKRNLTSKIFTSLFLNKKKYSHLLSKANEIGADVYNLHDLQLNHISNSLLKSNPSSKLIYSIHESYPDMIRDYRQTKGIRTIVKNLYSQYIHYWEIKKSNLAHHIVTFDDAGYKKFNKIFGREKVSLIYNFARYDYKDNGKSKKVYDLIYIGSVTLPRGIMQVLEAVRLCKKQIPNFRFLILGIIHEDGLRQRIIKFIREKEIEENVKIMDSIPHEEVKTYLNKSKIGIVTLLPISKYLKNIPIKQFEYMEAGLPVVGSKIPPIEHFIKEANAGIIVNPEDETEISEAILKLLSDKELYLQMSQNGKKAIEEKFNWGKMEEKMISIYSQLIQ